VKSVINDFLEKTSLSKSPSIQKESSAG